MAHANIRTMLLQHAAGGGSAELDFIAMHYMHVYGFMNGIISHSAIYNNYDTTIGHHCIPCLIDGIISHHHSRMHSAYLYGLYIISSRQITWICTWHHDEYK